MGMTTTRPASGHDARDAASYIETMAKELRAMAASADLGFLAYLLSMVEDDAADTLRRLDEKVGVKT
jgi:hypothetical protein